MNQADRQSTPGLGRLCIHRNQASGSLHNHRISLRYSVYCGVSLSTSFMYLFTADCGLLRSKAALQHLNVIRASGAALIWSDDPFTKVTESAAIIKLEIGRPGIDSESICSLQWDVSRSTVRQARGWSGEFPARFSEAPLLFASHAKLVALATRATCQLRPLSAGATIEADLAAGTRLRFTDPVRPAVTRLSYGETLCEVRRLVMSSVARLVADGTVVMLSGGVDSSIVVAAAVAQGIKPRVFTYALRHPPRPEHDISSDRRAAARVAHRLGLDHNVLELETCRLCRNIPLATYLAETSRGTIVDELAAHIEIARFFSAAGVRYLVTGEGADDLFGAFPFALRFYRGRELTNFLRSELLEGTPNELAQLQDVYTPWGITLAHPYWTSELRRIGFGLPLRRRIDRGRLMKRVLRDAFADLLDAEAIARPKGVPRDCAQIRQVLEAEFGTSPHRYRSILRTMMTRQLWPAGLPPLPKKSNVAARK